MPRGDKSKYSDKQKEAPSTLRKVTNAGLEEKEAEARLGHGQ